MFVSAETIHEKGASKMIQIFKNKETGVFFEYADLTDRCYDFTHKIFMSNSGIADDFRYGRVLQTVAHVCVDEDEYGKPVVEKWPIRRSN